MRRPKFLHSTIIAMAAGGIFFVLVVFGHCDTMNGPVVKDARRALDQGNVMPVLKWVGPGDEEKMKSAFSAALEERKRDPEGADMKFFEALIRAHRESEGQPYTGIKAQSEEPQVIVDGAEKAIETGSIDAIKEYVPKEDLSEIQNRLNQVVEKKKHADESVRAGRDFVDEYTNFLHSLQSLTSEAARRQRQ